jgi:hypothetical protein
VLKRLAIKHRLAASHLPIIAIGSGIASWLDLDQPAVLQIPTFTLYLRLFDIERI